MQRRSASHPAHGDPSLDRDTPFIPLRGGGGVNPGGGGRKNVERNFLSPPYPPLTLTYTKCSYYEPHSVPDRHSLLHFELSNSSIKWMLIWSTFPTVLPFSLHYLLLRGWRNHLLCCVYVCVIVWWWWYTCLPPPTCSLLPALPPPPMDGGEGWGRVGVGQRGMAGWRLLRGSVKFH